MSLKTPDSWIFTYPEAIWIHGFPIHLKCQHLGLLPDKIPYRIKVFGEEKKKKQNKNMKSLNMLSNQNIHLSSAFT